MRIRLRITLRSETVLIYLNKRELTQNWLADQMSTSAAQVSRWLTERQGLTPESRKRAQKVFQGYSWDKIFRIHQLGGQS